MPRSMVLIDGTNYAFRAFFAVPPLNNSKGFPTNALQGFTYNLLLDLIRREKPDYMVVAFDAVGPTFRKDQYEDYKAHRKPAPPELVQQLPYFRKVCEALSVPYFELSGYEADDIIATLATRHRHEDVQIRIISMDKDLMQLVGGNVILEDTLRKKVYDPAAVEEKWGVPPHQLRDLLALVGDASDNVPGVPSIGPKKARDLLLEFGTVEHLLAHLDQVRNQKVREALQNHVADARLSLELVTLHLDVPLSMPLESLMVGKPDPALAYSLFKELEFKRLMKEFEAAASQLPPVSSERGTVAAADVSGGLAAAPSSAESGGQPSASAEDSAGLGGDGAGAVSTASRSPATSEAERPPTITLVETPATLAALAGALKLASRVGVRTLTMDADEGCAAVALAVSPHEAYVVPFSGQAPGWLESVKHVLRARFLDRNLPKLGHNLKKDLHLLAKRGLELRGVGGDTELAGYLLKSSSREPTLPDLVSEHLNRSLQAAQPVQQVGEEASALLALHDRLKNGLAQAEMTALYTELELPLVEILFKLERRGIQVETSQLGQISLELEKRIAEGEQRIHTLAGEKFNPGSPKQLQVILFEKLKLPVQKKTKTGPSTDQEVLEALAEIHDLPAEILAYRSLVKLKGTYVDALPKLVDGQTSRIHTTFNQVVAATGRLSSMDPNLQNIPVRTEEGRRIREAFVAPPGHVLLSADYSQIELRLLAHFCEDETLIYAFTHGLDIHAATAADMFGVPLVQVTSEMRRSAKAINFGILYGMGAHRLARELKITRKEAEKFIEQYFGRYKRVKAYLETILDDARVNGYVTTWYKRRRYLPDLKASNFNVRQGAERMAINTPIQGSAADIIKVAMLRVEEALTRAGLRTRMLLQVHDELVFEVPLAELEQVQPLIKAEMEGVANLRVPLTVEVGSGQSWAGAH